MMMILYIFYFLYFLYYFRLHKSLENQGGESVKGEKKGVKCEKRGVKGEISRRDGENGIIYLAIGSEYGRPEGKR